MKFRKYARLTLDERRKIEQSLNQGCSLKSIACNTSRSTSTISREIQRNSSINRSGSERHPFNNCIHRNTCQEHDVCIKEDCTRDICPGCKFCTYTCKKYEPEYCALLKDPPYVCNSCKCQRSCTLEKIFYKARTADKLATNMLTEARSGVSLDEAERKRISDIVSPLIKKGQSPYHICLNNKDALMISDKTLYKYIDVGMIDATNTDLLRKVKMKPRKKKPQVKIEKACYEGRTYKDLLLYLDKNPDTEVVQMDTVLGKKGNGEKCLLTISFPHSELMLAFLRDANTARSVTDIFDKLKRELEFNMFEEVFPLLLADRGSEFSAPSVIEENSDFGYWTNVYFCDPNCAYQKPEVESGHRLIRMVLPKGTSFNRFTQKDIDLLMSHINSYKRKALGGESPIEVFARAHGNTVIKKFGLRRISPNDIVLNPNLLK